MKAFLIMLFLIFLAGPQEKPKQDTVKDSASIEMRYKIFNTKLDSIIATKQAEKMYNLSDTIK